MLFDPAYPSSILAFATTFHFALALLRNHRSAQRGPISPLTLLSLALGATPWVFPSLPGLALGVVVHLAWFVACEYLAPAPESPASTRPVPARTPATPAASASARPNRPAAAPQTTRSFVQVPVLAVVDEATDIKTIRVLRPEGFVFESGQFVTVRVRVDGKEYVRCYSISSSPSSEGFLEISVKRQGLVSNALHATARPGAILTIKSANGRFKYPSGDDRPIVLLAGGIGITPLVSMLRHAVHAEPSRRVTLLYSGHHQRDLAFLDELTLLARRHPQVRTIFALTREAAHGPSFYPGRIDAALLHATVPDIRDAISFICGPTAMIESMKAMLAEAGVPESQIRYEAFEAAVAASTGTRDQSSGEGSVASPPASRGLAAGTGQSANACQMRCLPEDQTIGVSAGQTILEAAEGNGVSVPSLCRAGVCGTCRVRVTAGDVECDSTTLDANELAAGFVLACVAQPRTDCTVQL